MAKIRRVAVTEVSHWHSTYDAAYLSVLKDLGTEIVGVSDRDQSIAQDRAARFDSKAFTDYRAMIDETRPEFVVALGRHTDMADIARHLIETGLPFIMEKPISADPATVAGVADLAESKGAWIAVPFPNRGAPFARKAREMLAAGEFGAVSHVFMRMIRPTMRRYLEWDSPWMWERAVCGGGALLNLGVHGMDMARYLLGEELTVAGAVINNLAHQAEVEDYALATLRSSSGVLLQVETGYTMPTWPANETDGEWKIAGEKALLRALPDGLQILGPGRDEFVDAPADVSSSYPGFVAEALRRAANDEPPTPNARDCANAVALIDKAYQRAGRV